MATDEELALNGSDPGAEPENQTDSAVDGIAELKRQLDAERAGRAEAEQRARAASDQAHQARNYAQDSDLQMVTAAIETIKGGNINLTQQYSAAMRAQDFDRASEVQQMMAMNAAKLLQLENGKEALASKPKQPAPQPRSDPVEQLASSSNIHPREAAWIRAHPDFARNEKLNNRLRGTYLSMLGEDFVPGTDEFINEMENRLGLRRQQQTETGDDPMSEAAKPTQRRSPPPAAPVSRNVAPGGQNTRVIRLSPEEVGWAKASGLTEAQYWENKQALRKEKRMN